MTKDLERDLGLPSVMVISIGAVMISAGESRRGRLRTFLENRVF